MKFTYCTWENGTLKFDHIKRRITLNSDNIKRLSLYFLLKHQENLNISRREYSVNSYYAVHAL